MNDNKGQASNEPLKSTVKIQRIVCFKFKEGVSVEQIQSH